MDRILICVIVGGIFVAGLGIVAIINNFDFGVVTDRPRCYCSLGTEWECMMGDPEVMSEVRCCDAICFWDKWENY